MGYRPRFSKPLTHTLYKTADAIDRKWNDMSLVGLCDVCGLDDSPIVVDGKWDGKKKCKWCAEQSNLSWHLKFFGGRRGQRSAS